MSAHHVMPGCSLWQHCLLTRAEEHITSPPAAMPHVPGCACCLQATPQANNLSAEDIDALTRRTQDGGTEVVQAKAGKVGSSSVVQQCSSGAVQASVQ